MHKFANKSIINKLQMLEDVLSNHYHEYNQLQSIIKNSGAFQGQCECLSIHPDFESDEYPGDKDYYQILDDAEKVFKNSKINIMRDEEFYEACIDEQGNVHGATVIREYFDDDLETPVVRFSVVVDESKRGAGVARKLIQSIVQRFKGHAVIEAFVINPNLVPLLESLGFDGNWSEHDPIMRLY